MKLPKSWLDFDDQPRTEFSNPLQAKARQMADAVSQAKDRILLGAVGMTREQAETEAHRFSVVCSAESDLVLFDGRPIVEFYPCTFDSPDDVDPCITTTINYKLVKLQ